MQNITGFGLENFRVFKDKVNFDFAPLTILTGTNNSGKSTVINAWKLLKENLKNSKSEWKEKPEENFQNALQRLTENNFDVHSLIERYGNLGQFINNSAESNEFSFSFIQKMVGIEDEAETIITIRINDNKLKDGKVVEYKMRSIKEDRIIFKIYTKEYLIDQKDWESADGSHLFPKTYLKLDFVYFFKHLQKRINRSINFFNDLTQIEKEKGDFQAFNEKYGCNYSWFDYEEDTKNGKFYQKLVRDNYSKPDFLLEPTSWESTKQDELKESYKTSQEKGLYDISFLLKDNEKIQAFKDLITNYYGESEQIPFKKISKDLLSLMSEYDWGQNYSISKEHKEDFSSFIIFLSSLSFSLSNIILSQLEFQWSKSSTRQNDSQSFSLDNLSILKNNLDTRQQESFLEKFFKPLIPILISKRTAWDSVDQEEITFDDADWHLQQKNEIMDFFKDTVLENLNLIRSALFSFDNSKFLSTNGGLPQRKFSLGQRSPLSLLVKERIGLREEINIVSDNFINKWIKKLGLGEKFEMKFDEDTGDFKPYITRNKKEILLADLGLGTSKLIPVLFMLFPHLNADVEDYYKTKNPILKRVVFIEEPEANLHPALQSKLADMFVEAIQKFRLQIILETHSEYLVRKLQYLTAKGEIDPDFTQIYYFYHPEKVPPGEKQVKKINIRKDGSLTEDFGRGFFDEADNIAMSIWSMNQSQKN